MFLALILALVLNQIPDAPTAKPQSSPASGTFELQGDKLGESVETFVSQHPKAECDKSRSLRAVCYQWADVAIFGISAHAGAKCNLKQRYAADCLQGITARFTEEHLVSLVYTVGGADISGVTAELKKKFGAPTHESRDGSNWSSGSESASVVVTKVMEEADSPSLITVSISVAS
jgi:hypothetical protein